MDNIFKKGIFVGLGLVSLTKEKVEEIIDDLSKRGELSEEESAAYVREVMEKIDARSEESKRWIEEKIDSAFSQINPKTRQELENLNKKVDQLEKMVKSLQKELASQKKAKA